MRTVYYEQTAVRDVEIEVTDEQYTALKSEGYSDAKDAAQQAVIDKALAAIDGQGCDWVVFMVNVTGKEGEESVDLFDIDL